MEDGFLLLAMGKPLYGRLAYNLAASIKTSQKGSFYPVYLAHYGDVLKDLNKKRLSIFDGLIPIPDEIALYQGKMMPFRVKLQLHLLTPFQNTIYLDADTVLFQEADVPSVFAQNKGAAFMPSLSQKIDKVNNSFNGRVHIWLDPQDIVKYFPQIETLYVVGSSFLYMERCSYVNQIMETCLALHDETYNRKIFIRDVDYRDGHIADEPILSLGLALQDFKPRFFPYQPLSHPVPFDNFIHQEKLMRTKTIGLTIPGEPAIRWYIYLYDRIVRNNDRRLGFIDFFNWDTTKAFSF